MTVENLNETLTDGFAIDLPMIESEAVLFKIEPAKIFLQQELGDELRKPAESKKKAKGQHSKNVSAACTPNSYKPPTKNAVVTSQ